MFHYINGMVVEIEPGLAVLDCGGVGFALNTTSNSLASIRQGEKAKMYVYPVIREDCFDLYGFATKAEKHSFELLLGVSGVGPRAALSILSCTTPEGLAMAVVSENERVLTAASGVGKKLAQRVILELKDKIAKETASLTAATSPSASVPVGGDKLADAAAALMVLGYGNNEIAAALRGVDAELSLEDIIRQALKRMLK